MPQFRMLRELQPLPQPGARPIAVGATPWRRLGAAMADPQFVAVAAFCAIGLLITMNVILRFPDFGATLVQFQQFP